MGAVDIQRDEVTRAGGEAPLAVDVEGGDYHDPADDNDKDGKHMIGAYSPESRKKRIERWVGMADTIVDQFTNRHWKGQKSFIAGMLESHHAHNDILITLSS